MNSSPVSQAEVAQIIRHLQLSVAEVRYRQNNLIELASPESPAHKQALAALREAVVLGLEKEEGDEAVIALLPLVDVLGELEGAAVCDLLIDICGSQDVEVRLAATNALQELAFERFKEVAQAAERACTRLAPSHLALREIPFVFVEITEPGAPRVLQKFLMHKEGEVVAAAIEALVQMGDPSAAAMLRSLTKDARSVQVPESVGVGAGEQVSLGLLAQQAIEILQEFAK